MKKFKTASRTPEEMKSAKADLNASLVDVLRGPSGTLNRRGMQKIHENRFDLAETIIQLITDEVTTTDPLPYLVDEVQGDIRNNYVWQRMTAGLRVVNRAYGSKPLSQRFTFHEFAISTTPREINVEIPLEEIAIGRITASMVAEQMAFAINRYRVSNVLNMLDLAVPSATNDHTAKSGYTLRYTGLTKANLDNALDGLLDETDVPTIMGRHIALYPAIRNFAGWSQLTTTEFEIRGEIGQYLGCPILKLQDGFSLITGTHVIRNDRVYIAGSQKGAIHMTKDLSFLNYAVVDERTATFSTGIRLEDGLLMHNPFLYRIIEA